MQICNIWRDQSLNKHIDMEMRKESGRVTKERELQDYIFHTVLITAGAAVLMACLKRAILMVFVMEQWRAWVFLLLNLVLLAIVFTSISSTSSSSSSSNIDPNQDCKNNGINDNSNEEEEMKNVEVNVGENENIEEEWFEDNPEEAAKLSKEALNERVEAFIVMFRQHLISDARNF